MIWLADTNYRLDLDNGAVRALAEADDLDALFAVDQVRTRAASLMYTDPGCRLLRQAMDTGVAFPGYIEGPLLFRPTYRYDFGTDNYDTSEKMRIPAWTGQHKYIEENGSLALISHRSHLVPGRPP